MSAGIYMRYIRLNYDGRDCDADGDDVQRHVVKCGEMSSAPGTNRGGDSIGPRNGCSRCYYLRNETLSIKRHVVELARNGEAFGSNEHWKYC